VPFRPFAWTRAHHEPEGSGPTIDDSIIIPNTAIDEVRAYLDTPEKLAAWFGATLDAEHHTLTISRTPNELVIAAVDTELIDRARCHTLTGITATGEVRGYLSLRTVACEVTAPGATQPEVGRGTEVWTHIDLPGRTPHAVVGFLHHIVHTGHRHLRGELGT
jgi:hypothetical protein